MATAIVPTVTGYQAFWASILSKQNGDDASGYAFPTAAQNGGRTPLDSQLARIFKRNTYRGFNELFLTLLGAAAGDTAAATHTQVGAPANATQASTPGVSSIGDFGGNRVIDTVTDINRATTAADITWLSKYFDNKLLQAGITYPTVSGSGGSGKLVNGSVRF